MDLYSVGTRRAMYGLRNIGELSCRFDVRVEPALVITIFVKAMARLLCFTTSSSQAAATCR